MILAQCLLMARVVAGLVLVGLTRPQLTPMCLGATNVLSLGAVVAGLDAAVVVAIAMEGLARVKMGGKFTIAVLAAAVWIGVSCPVCLTFGSL